MNETLTEVVAYSQLPQDTKKYLDDLNTKYGYNDIILDWNGTPGSNDLLINGIPASDKRFRSDTVPAFVIKTDKGSRLLNIILSNIANDFNITIKDKNPVLDQDDPNVVVSTITLPEVVETDLFQFPIISDADLAKLNTTSFFRKLNNEGVLGRNKLIEFVKPNDVNKYTDDDEILVSITNNQELIEFSVIFKTFANDISTMNNVTMPGTVKNTTDRLCNSYLDNIFPVPFNCFTNIEWLPIFGYCNSFNKLKSYQAIASNDLSITRTVLVNKQLLNAVIYFRGDSTLDRFDDNGGLTWLDSFTFRTEKVSNDPTILNEATSMSLKAFSLPILVMVTDSYSRWNNNTNEAFPTILNTYLVKPYFGTLKAAISNNQIIIPDDENDTGGGTWTWESELKYPDLTNIINSYSDTTSQSGMISYTTSDKDDSTSLEIVPITVDGNPTGKYKTVTHYVRDDENNNNETIPVNITGTFKTFTYTDIVTIGTSDSTGVIYFDQGNQISIMKGGSAEFTFRGTKAASVSFNTDNASGIEFEVELDQKSTLPNELGDKFYSTFTGKAKVSATASATVGDFTINCQLLNSDGNVTATTTYTVKVTKPYANPRLESTRMLQVNKDVKTTLSVTCSQVFVVKIKEPDSLQYATAKITNVTHSDVLNDSETYDEYKFDIVFTPKGKAGNEKLVLILKDQDAIEVEEELVLNVYNPIYDPVEKFMLRLDGLAGHEVKFSYNEKKGYIIPAAFINNGEEAAGLLVAKYPVSQEAISATTVDETLNNLSKPYRSRARLYTGSKQKDNTGPEGGELHKLVMPHGIDNVLTNIKNSALLNNRAWVVANSAALDTMLANMSDASYIARLESGKFDYNPNYSIEMKPLDPNVDVNHAESDALVNIDNTGINLQLTIARSNDIIYTTVDEVKELLFSRGAIWDSGKVYYSVTSNGLVENVDEKIFGDINSPVFNTLDKTKTIAFPIIPSYSLNTHNGEANGIVDSFGAGIKVYTDILYVNENGIDKIKILDPYTTRVDYELNTDKEGSFVTIPFKENMFITNTDYVCYIGPNENDINSELSRSVFSNYSYDQFKSGYLMDSVGLPMDNIVIDYPDDTLFKGNAGYSSVPNYHYGRSAYYLDYKQIIANGGTKGYFVSGTVGNDKLLIGNRNEIHTDNLDWVNLYKNKKNIFDGKDSLNNGNMTAGNRTRVLLHENVLYGINKSKGFTDDNVYYNNRLHFFIYDLDRVDRNQLVNLKINNKFIELEETKSVVLDIVTDGTVEISSYDKEGIFIDQNTMKVTGLTPGQYEFTVYSKATGKDTASSRVYVKVKDLLPMTELKTDVTVIIGKTSDTKNITITTNATDISTVITSEHAKIVSKQNVGGEAGNVFLVVIELLKATSPETSIIISCTADGSKTASVEIPIVISQRVPTKYEVLVKNFSVSNKAELQGTLNTNFLAKKLGLEKSGINLTDTKQLTIWSPQLAGQAWKVNNDYTFGIDFGNGNYNTYVINYEAQLDQEYEYNGIITADKPRATIYPNLNNTVSGTITISVLTT